MSEWEKSKRKFTVVINVEEYLQLCSWVLKHENIETGGDLFGLWADDRTAVIQLVLGPGKNCRRTSVSFYQDVEYLKKVGSYLTGSEGLCHIGEWHSHHQLGLARPSGGDESTVWNNMPTYELDRFVIFIANIGKDRQSFHTNVGCFLFEIESNSRRRPVLEGQFIMINESSPMRSKLQTMRGNNATEVFIEECESLNPAETLESLSIPKDYLITGRIGQVSKMRDFTQRQYDGTRQGMGKGNAKKKKSDSETQESKQVQHSLAGEKAHTTISYTQTNRNTAPRGAGNASEQQRSKTDKEVTKNREGVTMKPTVEIPNNVDVSVAAARIQSGDTKQVSTHKSNGRSQQGAKGERNESSSKTKSQGKPRAVYPGHAKPQEKKK